MLGPLLGPAHFDLDVLPGQVLHHRLMHLLKVRPFVVRFFITVVGLTCNTRAVS